MTDEATAPAAPPAPPAPPRTAAQLQPGDLIVVPVLAVTRPHPGITYAEVEFPWAGGQVALLALVDRLPLPDPLGPAPLARPTLGEPADPAELEDAARALAHISQHARYVHAADGWRALIGAEALIKHAYAAALKRPGGLDAESLAVARNARDLLLADHARRTT